MFVPIGDDNPLKSIRFQYVTVALIIVNALVFLLQSATGSSDALSADFAVVPRELFQAGIFSAGDTAIAVGGLHIAEPITLVTYMFLHGDPMHLIGNLLFLWVFGDNVEDALGHGRYLLFYLACGVAAGLLHAVVIPDSSDALIGASGAVSGVIAAYLMLHPRVGVWVLAFKIIPLKITAAFVLGLWILTQVIMVALPQVGPTAWWAHIGGLCAGAALVIVMRRRGVPLFAE